MSPLNNLNFLICCWTATHQPWWRCISEKDQMDTSLCHPLLCSRESASHLHRTALTHGISFDGKLKRQFSLYKMTSGSEFVLPCNHTLDRRHWFHTHTSCYPPSYVISLCSSCSPSVNTYQTAITTSAQCTVSSSEKNQKGPTSGSLPLPAHASFCFFVTSHFT